MVVITKRRGVLKIDFGNLQLKTNLIPRSMERRIRSQESIVRGEVINFVDKKRLSRPEVEK